MRKRNNAIIGFIVLGIAGILIFTKLKPNNQTQQQSPPIQTVTIPETPSVIEPPFINASTPSSPYGYGDFNAAKQSLTYLQNRLDGILAARPKESTRTQEINSWDIRYLPMVDPLKKEIAWLDNYIKTTFQ